MNKKTEKLQANIPANSKWNLEAADKRAKELGLDRSGLIIRGMELVMNFDEEFLKYIKHYAEGLKVPEYLVIENKVLKDKADEEAYHEVYKEPRTLPEFKFITYTDGKPTVIRGLKLVEMLKKESIQKYQFHEDRRKQRLDLLESVNPDKEK